MTQLKQIKNRQTKTKTDKINKVVNTNKQDKNLFYNSQQSFLNLKNVNNFKELSLDSMHKKLNDFHKKFTIFKKLNPQTKEKEYLEEKVKDNAGDLFIELYYIYKERYSEEKNWYKDTEKFDYKKLRLADDYECESE